MNVMTGWPQEVNYVPIFDPALPGRSINASDSVVLMALWMGVTAWIPVNDAAEADSS